MSESLDTEGSLAHPDRWASLHTLLAECLKEPSEGFVEELQAGALESELTAHADAVSLSITAPSPPPTPDRDALQRAYLSLFEAMHQPFAPPAESPYKPWYGDRNGGLMGGPAATEMERRYEAIEASPPPGYPADHVALLLEYGALLLDAGAIEEYRDFLETHLDWVGALARQIDASAVESPFYEWTVARLREVLAELRTRLGVSEPADSTVDSMVERVAGIERPDPPGDVLEQQGDRFDPSQMQGPP
jgi:TorA maturation chaperone TorD